MSSAKRRSVSECGRYHRGLGKEVIGIGLAPCANMVGSFPFFILANAMESLLTPDSTGKRYAYGQIDAFFTVLVEDMRRPLSKW
jgi:hypothetical protein